MSDYKIEPTKRQVIENKLLTALQADGVCAALLCEEDIGFLILGLRTAIVWCEDKGDADKMRELAEALCLLRRSVYGTPF